MSDQERLQNLKAAVDQDPKFDWTCRDCGVETSDLRWLIAQFEAADALGEAMTRAVHAQEHRAEHAEAKAARFAQRIADIAKAQDDARLAIARVELWCDEQDALSKGPSPTTNAIRKALRGDA